MRLELAIFSSMKKILRKLRIKYSLAAEMMGRKILAFTLINVYFIAASVALNVVVVTRETKTLREEDEKKTLLTHPKCFSFLRYN